MIFHLFVQPNQNSQFRVLNRDVQPTQNEQKITFGPHYRHTFPSCEQLLFFLVWVGGGPVVPTLTLHLKKNIKYVICKEWYDCRHLLLGMLMIVINNE